MLTGRKLEKKDLESILAVVVFLNHIGHLIRYGYVNAKQMLLLYSPSIAECERNLTGEQQWLREIRRLRNDNRYYLHFGKLCEEETQALIWDEKEDKIVWTGDKYIPSPVLGSSK
jgi:hypothetical protein